MFPLRTCRLRRTRRDGERRRQLPCAETRDGVPRRSDNPYLLRVLILFPGFGLMIYGNRLCKR